MNIERVLQILRGGEYVSREGGIVMLIVVFLILVTGMAIGLVFWKQYRLLATMIESSTRQNQSDYDLVSRDIVKVKQDVDARARQIPNPKT